MDITKFNYFIVFHNTRQEVRDYFLLNSDTYYLFDKDIEKAIPALEFVLHLPRSELDMLELNEKQIDMLYEYEHNIFLIPNNFINEVYSNRKELFSNSLLFYYDECFSDIEKFDNQLFKFGCYPISSISEKLLNEVYLKLENYIKNRYKNVLKHTNIHLLRDDSIVFLTSQNISRQYDTYEKDYDNLIKATNKIEKNIEIYYNHYLTNKILLKMNKEYGTNISNEKYNKIFCSLRDKIISNTLINETILYPGISKKVKEKYGLALECPQSEYKVLKIIAIHKAISKNALYLELPEISKEIYNLYSSLEENCSKGTNNKFIWKCIYDLGKMFKINIGEKNFNILLRANHIDLISNIPINIFNVHGLDVSWGCYKKISYNPISPLTRNLQIELNGKSPIIINKKCKIAYLECVNNTTENRIVLQNSTTCSKIISEIFINEKNVVVDIVNIKSKNEIESYINNNKDIDILCISSHGFYNQRNNTSGLLIGNDEWYVESNLKMPPLVILMSCVNSVRSNICGAVSDMFIRNGALAVLGSNIPVTSYRNSIIITRFFVYIYEAMKGSKQYRTLLDVWQGIVLNNAIYEIIEESQKLKKWMYEKNNRNQKRIDDFCNRANSGKLNLIHNYYSSIEILKEMLKEENMEDKYSTIFDNLNYFPESYFYQFIGSPEKIVLF